MNKTYQRIALCSLSVILAAQLSVNLFFADFEISVAVTLLPLFLFLMTDFPLPATTLCAAAGVFLMRLFLSFLRYGDLQVAERLFPEMIFYISYGLLLYLCDRLRQKKAAGYRILLPFLVGIDYISNLLELLFRAGTDAFHPSTQLGIFLVAVLRTLVIACVLLVFRQYRRILLRREHEKRYQELLLLISRLNGEVLWMDKNTTLIEQTMNTSYHLYEQLKNSPALEEQARSALAKTPEKKCPSRSIFHTGCIPDNITPGCPSSATSLPMHWRQKRVRTYKLKSFRTFPETTVFSRLPTTVPAFRKKTNRKYSVPDFLPRLIMKPERSAGDSALIWYMI